MNYQSNLNTFQNKLEKEVTKLFKLHENSADQQEIENQEVIVDNLNKVVESLQVLAEM